MRHVYVHACRYSTPKGEILDVMYRNIRFAFFQPAENEMVTILHFHLHHPIMVGNKKSKDVQFYAEVMETVQTLDGGRRNMYDPDEIGELLRTATRGASSLPTRSKKVSEGGGVRPCLLCMHAHVLPSPFMTRACLCPTHSLTHTRAHCRCGAAPMHACTRRGGAARARAPQPRQRRVPGLCQARDGVLGQGDGRPAPGVGRAVPRAGLQRRTAQVRRRMDHTCHTSACGNTGQPSTMSVHCVFSGMRIREGVQGKIAT